MIDSAVVRKDAEDNSNWGINNMGFKVLISNSSVETIDAINSQLSPANSNENVNSSFKVWQIYKFTSDDLKIWWKYVTKQNWTYDYWIRKNNHFEVEYVSDDWKTVDIKIIWWDHDWLNFMVPDTRYLSLNSELVK